MYNKFYQINGIELHSFEEGELGRKIIIFLHGFPEYGGAWRKQLSFMAQNGYHAIAPDQRGYNLSSKLKRTKLYLIDKLVADIVALIHQLTTTRVILVGHDWGGGVAWELAMRHQELLRELVILNMPHPAVMVYNLKNSPKQMGKSWYTGFFQLPWLPEVICKSFDFKYLERSLISTANKNTFSKDQIDQYKQAWRQPYALTSMINWYRAFKYYSVKDEAVNVPTLIIWGVKDQFLNVEMAQSSLERCTNGKLFLLEDATHWLHHEKAEEINPMILNFIQNAPD